MNTENNVTFHPDLMPERDTDGFVLHPHIEMVLDAPLADEGAVDNEKLEAAGFEAQYICMDDDVAEDHPARAEYFERGNGYAAWIPSTPKGDGWWLVGVYDAEDGPAAMFVRRTAGQVLN